MNPALGAPLLHSLLHWLAITTTTTWSSARPRSLYCRGVGKEKIFIPARKPLRAFLYCARRFRRLILELECFE